MWNSFDTCAVPVAVVAIIAFIRWRRTIAGTVNPYIEHEFYLRICSNSSISLQLHLEGSNETAEENQKKDKQDDFFASEEQFTSSSSILEEPAAALVKPKSPRDLVKNGDDGPAPDVSMAVSGEVRRCFLVANGQKWSKRANCELRGIMNLELELSYYFDKYLATQILASVDKIFGVQIFFLQVQFNET